MKKLFMLMTMVIFTVLLTSCATIVRNGDQDTVAINANVKNAKVYINNQYRGVAPVVVTLDPTKTYNVKVVAPGKSPFIAPISKKLNKWFWLNIISGGPIGMVVDIMTGKGYEFQEINANL